MKNKVTLLTAIFIILIASMVSAEAPNYINYQGRLLDDTGEPVSDGDYSIFFMIYDSETGGAIRWSSDRMTVPVADGLFSVKLGPMTPGLFASTGDRYLEIRVGADPAITPRTHLVSVPYALNAASSGWTDNGTDVVLTTSSDYVGIGTDTPPSGTKLTVYASGDDRTAYFQASGQHSFQSYNSVPNGIANAYSIYGRAAGGDGNTHGLYGLADGSDGTGIGVLGSAHSNPYNSLGVAGRATSETGAGNFHTGVQAMAEHGLVQNTGIVAFASGSGSTNYGIFATAQSGIINYAGYFNGDVHITGTLTGGKSGIPTGGIIMWSGNSDKIPDGWTLCDGFKGTPDLTSQFIMETDKASSLSDYKLAYIMKQ